MRIKTTGGKVTSFVVILGLIILAVSILFYFVITIGLVWQYLTYPKKKKKLKKLLNQPNSATKKILDCAKKRGVDTVRFEVLIEPLFLKILGSVGLDYHVSTNGVDKIRLGQGFIKDLKTEKTEICCISLAHELGHILHNQKVKKCEYSCPSLYGCLYSEWQAWYLGWKILQDSGCKINSKKYWQHSFECLNTYYDNPCPYIDLKKCPRLYEINKLAKAKHFKRLRKK